MYTIGFTRNDFVISSVILCTTVPSLNYPFSIKHTPIGLCYTLKDYGVGTRSYTRALVREGGERWDGKDRVKQLSLCVWYCKITSKPAAVLLRRRQGFVTLLAIGREETETNGENERERRNVSTDREGCILNESGVLGMRVVSIVPGSGLIQHHPHQHTHAHSVRYALPLRSVVYLFGRYLVTQFNGTPGIAGLRVLALCTLPT